MNLTQLPAQTEKAVPSGLKDITPVPTHAKGMSVHGAREPTLDVGTHKYFPLYP